VRTLVAYLIHWVPVHLKNLCGCEATFWLFAAEDATVDQRAQCSTWLTGWVVKVWTLILSSKQQKFGAVSMHSVSILVQLLSAFGGKLGELSARQHCHRGLAWLGTRLLGYFCIK